MLIVRIRGIGTVVRNLKRFNARAAAGLGRGLKKGGLYLQAESQKIVPYQLGHLHGSAFCRNVGGGGFDTDIVVGYTADYATYVHEDLERLHGKAFNIEHAGEIAAAKGTKRGTAAGGMFNRGENQQAKFLEKPAREKRSAIIRIIKAEVKKG